MKKVLSIAAFAICLITAAGLAGSSLQAKTIKKSFDVKTGGRLVVDSDRGSIEVRSEPGNTLNVEVIKRVRGGDDDHADELMKKFKIKFNQSGDQVEVTGRMKDGWFGRNTKKLQIHFRITVPAAFNLDLKTSGGSISVDDLQGEVIAETAGGSLEFGKIDGPVNGKTAGGSIRLDGSKGPVRIKTAGGSIQIGEVEGDVEAKTAGGSISIDKARGNVIAKTAGGSINVDEVMGNIDAATSGGSIEARLSKQPQADCSLKTSGGSVIVYLADDIAVDLDARSNSGKVSCDLDIKRTSSAKRKSELRGKINGGGPTLYLRTSAGKVSIREL